jgi:hypothetical protein
VDTRNAAVAILSALIFNGSLWAKRSPKVKDIAAMSMEDSKHGMVAVSCQVNGGTRRYLCVIDSGATYTVISDRVLKAEGTLVELATANGLIKVYRREVSLTMANGLKLRTEALVQPNMTLQDVDILVGEDVLRQFRFVVFDYEKQRVEFYR